MTRSGTDYIGGLKDPASAARGRDCTAPMTDGAVQQSFRDAMALLATGVTVITTKVPDGFAGMTASAVCSLSLAPAQLLVCINCAVPTHQALEGSGAFAVNVLGEDQAPLAVRFATPDIDRFEGVAIDERCGMPVLADAISYFVCDVRERFPVGITRSSSAEWSNAGTPAAVGRCCISNDRSEFRSQRTA